MSHVTYLGPKGYSIYKKTLSVKEQIAIREDLTVRPYIPKAPVQPTPYPIYLESTKKFYMPREYGLNTFGPPNDHTISKGTPITLKFNGELRELQQNIINKFVKSITDGGYGGLLDLFTGCGKTVLGLKIIAELKVKTLIIVHKGFLVDQWIERIQQFLPDARVGKIQGQIIDIDDKDIVIGMLQSLSMKDYPEDQFVDFGLTIIDECHHIAAETFVRALQKIVTMYILGLSATMNRKDGLSNVFKMFIGDIIHKEKREDDQTVLIKAVEFNTCDAEFNQIEYDFRGNAKYSTMITKLCSFNMRSELILKVLIKELTLNSSQQVMILAHNKNLLTYLYKAIEHRSIATVGYYVGGMKQKDLKISETKQVVIATFSMASEGLDIKTLTTLILATPKTDVEQAVGRIMRVKHQNPLIIDIIDSHSIFRNQWTKRKTFYLKNNYKIMYTCDYVADKWDTIVKKSTKTGKKGEKIDIPMGKCLITVD